MAGAQFENQCAWITGASSGIGRALAVELARRGADVAVSARREDRLSEVAREVEALGRRALPIRCDVRDEDSVKSAAETAAAELGRLDVAIANAGFSVSGRVEDLAADDWRRQFDVNVVGAAITARHALPMLRESGGRLCLVGSVASMVTRPGNGPYAASKAALRVVGQTLSMELHGTGVSCTTVHPGFVESEIGRVDNLGRFRPEREDRRPKRLMWPADRAARRILDALHQRKRELVFTGHGKVGGFVGRHFPALVHLAVTRRS